MRHSRTAVMAERYKLYMKKHIFNGKYFVRNMQIAGCFLVATALTVGGIAVVKSDTKGEVVTASANVSVKDVLLGNTEITEQTIELYSTTEEATTQAVQATDVTVSSVSDAETAVIYEGIALEDSEEEIVATPEEPKSKFENKCIANVDETLNIRREPSSDAEFVGMMNSGAIAIVKGTEGEWTKIKSGDVEGYVLTDYILTGSVAESFAENYVTLRGTVLEDGVNIREQQSVDSDILAVVDKDATLSVVKEEVAEDTTEDEQSADEIEWISVVLEDGQTGYVSAEFVEIDELYEIAVSAEELERIAAEEEARRLAEEEAARQAELAANAVASTNSSTANTSYQGATTTPVTATTSGECIGTFTVTAYCGCSKCSSGNNRTASGTVPTEGRTIAADTSVLPYGTQVVIDGVVYTVEDCGSGVCGNHIDIFFATHEKALAFGRKTIKVYKY